MPTKLYVTTEAAGWRVAGRIVPAAPLIKGGDPRPLVGHELHLTDTEAEYELLQGSIKLKVRDIQKPSDTLSKSV